MFFQDTQFIGEAAVEHIIGIFLKGEDVLFFAFSYIRPSADGFLCRISPILMISYDSAQEPAICSGDSIVVVDIQLIQRGDIDASFSVLGDGRSKVIIQSMNTFHDNDIVLFHLHKVVAAPSDTSGKVIMGQFDLFTGQKLSQLKVQIFQIDGMDGFEVIISILFAGCAVAI